MTSDKQMALFRKNVEEAQAAADEGCNIYLDHLSQVEEQLSREPFPFPTLGLRTEGTLFDYGFDDIVVEDYRHHPTIKGRVSV